MNAMVLTLCLLGIGSGQDGLEPIVPDITIEIPVLPPGEGYPDPQPPPQPEPTEEPGWWEWLLDILRIPLFLTAVGVSTLFGTRAFIRDGD